MITITNKDRHVLSKALKEKGYNDFWIIFAPKFSPDFGWTVVKGNPIGWLGYDKKQALKTIELL